MLAGCADKEGVKTTNAEVGQETDEANKTDETEALTASADQTEERDWSALYDGYIDIDSLPVLDMDIDREYVCDDRTLIMEDSIENELEHIVYKRYYDIVSADFDSLMKNIGGSKSYRIANQNEKKSFDEGLYMKGYDIYEISAVKLEELKTAGDASKEELISNIEECGLESYAVVKIELSWKYNEAQMEASPQLPEGRYIRYYLVGNTQSDPDIKICQTYWDEFI